VEEAIAAGAMMSVVNVAEAFSAIAREGADVAAVAYGGLALNDPDHGLIEVAPVTIADAVSIGVMWTRTAARGLSLGDRACLALASRLGVPALTADRAWQGADVEAVVSLIR
jgi:PIN domain nuclease of toxin-antitoxin system